MADNMFFNGDERGLRRGQRVAARTDTCRPCIVTPEADTDAQQEGVVLDMNPYGLRIRLVEPLPIGSRIGIQLMRDESFRVPLSRPLHGAIVRFEASPGGFVDHGIKLDVAAIPRAPRRPILISTRRRPRPVAGAQRMHIIDYTVGGPARPGRNRR